MSSSNVCSRCLASHPARIDLITYKCFEDWRGEHAYAPKVAVTWTANRRLERVHSGSTTPLIRPVPLRVYFRGGFVLCDGNRCRGAKCTHPHSVEERDAWNEQKFGSSRADPPGTQPYTPAVTPSDIQFGSHSQPLPVSSPPRPLPVSPPPQSQLPTSRPLPGSQLSWADIVKPKRSRYPSDPVASALPSGRPPQRARQPSDPTELQRTQQLFGPPGLQGTHQSRQLPIHGTAPMTAKKTQPHTHTPVEQTGFQAQPYGYQPKPTHTFDPYGEVRPPIDASQLPWSHFHQWLLSTAPEPVPAHTVSQVSHPRSPVADWPNVIAPVQSVRPQRPVSPVSPVFFQDPPTTTPPAANLPTSHPPAAFQLPPNTATLVGTRRPAHIEPRHIWDYAARKPTFQERLADPLMIADVQQQLGRGNYQEKFHKLLCWEESAHIEILKDRCDGQYTLVLHQAGLRRPEWMRYDGKPVHKRFGYLLDMNGDQIAYATQASEGAVIVQDGSTVKADILRENFQHTEERLYVAFDKENVQKLEKCLHISRNTCCRMVIVRFELKHSYFDSLHRSLNQLRLEVISRILPEEEDFSKIDIQSVPIPRQYKTALQLSPDQVHALQTIVSCPPKGPPVLIAGPFGTGKTRILATAAHYFLQQGRRSVRVLVCTQQQVSADTFLQCYLDLMMPPLRDVFIVRLTTEFGYRRQDLRRWYKTVAWLRKEFERSSDSRQRKFLIITTCQMALQIIRILGREFFTHILLDEGAQMREPEGVAPLCMASKYTKIVIAGDQHQVGPAMLVLGKEAQDHGLAESLLQRLHKRYREMPRAVAERHYATLVTNYRCHKDILNLSGNLFYNSPLVCKVPSDSTHPDAPFPLLFVCSSIDNEVKCMEDAQNEEEAIVALKEAARLANHWPADRWGPKDLNQTCFMSPTRSQITIAGKLLYSRELRLPFKLRDIRRLPAYVIQGHEFRALFLSTSEPTWKNGETRNPTKSICDRYVFNTAITRARSLVVSVGNPFMLLKTESHMIMKYGEKGKCWSQYLKTCLDHGTLSIHSSLGLSSTEQQACIEKLKRLVERQLAVVKSPTGNQARAHRGSHHLQEELSHSTATDTDVSECTSTQYTEPSIEVSMPQPQPSPVLPGLAQMPEDSASPSQVEKHWNGKFKKEYEMRQRLGKGGFGVVYRVRKKFDQADYAVKIVRLPKSKSSQDRVLREVHALARLDHPRIVRYFDAWMEAAPVDWRDNDPWSALKNSSESFSLTEESHSPTVTAAMGDSSAATTPSSAGNLSQATGGSASEGNADQQESLDQQESSDSESDRTPKVTESEQAVAAGTGLRQPPTCLFIQTQLCKEETLRHWLNKNRDKRSRKTILGFFEQILEAVCYIHKKDFIHRDLKPANIFFSPEYAIKVGDFGLVKGNVPDIHSLTPPTHQQSPPYQSPAGTLLYMSPEQLSSKRYDRKVDMFALGVTFFEMYCPFQTDMERFKVLTEVRNQRFPRSFVDKYPRETRLIDSLLAPEPAKRPSAEELSSGTLLREFRKAVKKSKITHVTKL